MVAQSPVRVMRRLERSSRLWRTRSHGKRERDRATAASVETNPMAVMKMSARCFGRGASADSEVAPGA